MRKCPSPFSLHEVFHFHGSRAMVLQLICFVAGRFHDMRSPTAKSVNKVILLGNVGQDPEVKYTASGVPVAKVSLATNERFKDKNDQWQDKTEWHSVVAWQRLAEIVGECVRKGSKLYVEGKLQTSTWEGKQNGEKKYRTEIVAREIVLLGSRDSRQEGSAEMSGAESSPAPVSTDAEDGIPF
jgi:single-strand DNA-binding protein